MGASACSMAMGSSNLEIWQQPLRESNYIDILPDVLRRRPRQLSPNKNISCFFGGGSSFGFGLIYNWHLVRKATGHCACLLTKANLLFAFCIKSNRCLNWQAFKWRATGMLMWAYVLLTVDNATMGRSYHYLHSSLYVLVSIYLIVIETNTL